MRLFCAIILLFLSSVLHAQMSQLEISSSDSLLFTAIVDGHELSDSAVHFVTYDTRRNEVRITIMAEDSLRSSLEQTLNLRSDFSTTFDLRMLRGQLVLLEVAATALAPENNELDVEVDVPLDSLASLADSLTMTPPMESQEFRALIEQLEDAYFESDRLKFINQASGQMDLRVEQLVQLLTYFELEDRKLQVVRALREQTRDFEQHKKQLEGSFLLDSSIAALRSM